MRENKKLLGTLFISIIIILIFLGLGIIASVSYPRGQIIYHESNYFFYRQIIWFIVGGILFWFISKNDYRKYKKNVGIFYIVGFAALIAVLFIGRDINGAKRWLGIGSIGIQPSEFTKIILILNLSKVIEKYKKRKVTKKNKKKLLIEVAVLTIVYLLLVMKERAFSNTVQIFLIAYLMVFFSGISLYIVIAIGILSGIASGFYIFLSKYSLLRIDKYLGKVEDGHTINSLIAIRRGNFFGRGYGNGFQKYFNLSEIHTDYIFAGFAEEMGFVGSVALIILYIILLLVIVITALKIKDLYGRYILLGIFVMLSIQIIGNIMVVTGLIPPTGIPLPLISYGGSTVISTMSSLGIVYSIIKSLYIQENE